MIVAVGKTSDDKIVVQGVYRFYETFGIPFDFIVSEINQRNMIPDWVHEYVTMLAAGMKKETVQIKIQQVISDVYGFELRELWDKFCLTEDTKCIKN